MREPSLYGYIMRANSRTPLRKRIPRSLRERRHARRRHSGPGARTAAQPARTSTQPRTPAPLQRDPAVQRVREAGGPLDRASYNCECGFVFVAPVSTTVKCPHCHTGQAW